MADDGAFSDSARAAIYTAADQRCVGCGRTDLSAQHRSARGMGGTSGSAAAAKAHPTNGLALCGDGARGCHGWAEHNPEFAALLGWRLTVGQDTTAPFWQRVYGWRRWQIDADGFVSVAYVHEDDLDMLRLRTIALNAFQAALADRMALWSRAPGKVSTGPKPTR